MRLLARHAYLGCCVLVSLVAACGGASSSLGGGDAGGGSPDGGGGDTGASSSGADSGGGGGDGATSDSASSAESGSSDSGSGSSDTGSPGSDAGCVALGSGATDVYVDQRYTGSSPTGVQACPFPTITQGLAAAATLSGNRTVHVAGATPALIYAEASSLTVDVNVTLEGDGPNKTTISATGACGSGMCAVQVHAGGTLEGFTVTSPGGDAIVTGDGSPSPAVKVVTASGAKGNGLLAMGGVELGPNFSANGNGTGSSGGAGVESPQGAGGVIHVIGTANTFDDDKGNGIDVNGSAILNFEGGEASRDFQGIRLAGAGAAISGHTITSLTAKGNTGPGGVVAYNGQIIKMRSSTLTGNSGVGLYYAYVNGSTLDIGTAQNPGNNVFGGATASDRNTLAGLRVCGVTAANQQPAAGDSWSACAPTQAFLDCNGNAGTSYSDIYYGPNLSSAGVPVDVTSCTVGP